MDSGRSLTNIIMEGFTPATVSTNIPLRNDVQARDEVAAVVKGIQKRSKNFTVKEDEMVVSAWLNMSLNPVRGVNQSKIPIRKEYMITSRMLIPITHKAL